MIDEKKLIEEMQEEYRKNIQNEKSIGDVLLNEGFKNAIAFVKKQPKVMEWIPVTERLPEKPESDKEDVYLVQHAYVRYPFSAWWDGERFTDVDDCLLYYVIAWAELPEPYKGE